MVASSDSEVTTELDAVDVAHELVAERVALLVRHGGSHEVLELEGEREVTLGRADHVDVRIDEPKISRVHARIARRGSELWLSDESSNGTRVNGTVVRSTSCPLFAGDVVQLGSAEVIVVATHPRHSATRRIDFEIARAAAAGAPGTLLRVASRDDPDNEALAIISRELGAIAVVESQPDGAVAAWVANATEVEIATCVATLRRALPGVELIGVSFPDDGKSFADLWRTAAAKGDDVAVEAPRGVCIADPHMTKLFRDAARAARTDTTVLLLGETGVGKEVFAEHIHRNSPRSAGPFLRLNCASLPESLLASELFGHERGAFTGAEQRKIGYFEASHGGTLLLDEIGELALPLQASLLRALENRSIVRLGSVVEIPIDARIVCATHRDLEAEVAAGRFRADLYYRVSVFTLRVPPLRERRAEVVPLAESFLRQLCEREGRRAPELDEEAVALLLAHTWPGNVRELVNTIEHALIMCDGRRIRGGDLPESLTSGSTPESAPGDGSVKERLERIERASIVKALADCGQNQTHAAVRLGLSRRALIYKMGKYGLGRGNG